MADETTTKKTKKTKEKGEKGRSNTVPALIIAVAILAGFKFFGGGGGSAAPVTPAEAAAHAEEEPLDCAALDRVKPRHGEAVFTLEPMTVNLAEGHFLKIAVGLKLDSSQSVETWKEENLGAVAADAVIATLGGRSVDEVARIREVKEQLTERIRPLYECNVLDVLVTDYVMQ